MTLLVLAAAFAAGCPDLLANAACEEDENCPNDTVCGDEGFCVDPADGGEEGEGEEGEGEEGEGEAGEGEGEAGEGEGEAGEGEGEGEGEAGEGEGEGGEDNCSPGAVEVSSDEELAVFQGCVELIGEIVIVGGDITTLASLSDLESVDGSISFVDLENIGEIDGALASLGQVTGDLEVNGGGAENIIDGLVGLTDVDGELVIAETDIVTLRGFGSLVSIGGDLDVSDNLVLEALGDGVFASLEVIGDSILVEGNPSLRPCLFAGLAELAQGEPGLDDRGGNSDDSCEGKG